MTGKGKVGRMGEGEAEKGAIKRRKVNEKTRKKRKKMSREEKDKTINNRKKRATKNTIRRNNGENLLTVKRAGRDEGNTDGFQDDLK